MHDHSHQHTAHSHDHTHSMPEGRAMGRVFLIATLLNVAFIGAEVFYGYLADSLALIADAGHNASDVLGLLMAWGAMALGRSKPKGRYTYGLQSATIMAALANALLLLLAVGFIFWEAVQRFSAPELPDSTTVMLVAFIGTIINGLSAWFLHGGHAGGHTHDLNVRGAYLHMLADAGISLGVVLSGGAIMATGWLWIDPLASILIALMIVIGTWRLLRDSLSLALHAAPRGIDLEEVRAFLKGQQGVAGIHDLHIWAMSTSNIALSTHLLMPGGHPGDGFIHTLNRELASHFGIDHTTIQIETSSHADDCQQARHVH